MLRVVSTSVEELPKKPQPPYLASAAPVEFGEGFYFEEHGELGAYRWMDLEGRLTFAPRPVQRFLETEVLCELYDLSQIVTIRCGEETIETPLAQGWSLLSLPVPAGASEMTFSVNKPFPKEYYPADPRTLAIRLRPPLLHADAARHAQVAPQHANKLANTRELLEGRAALDSTPPFLGIDMYGVCNVKPPCVYCEWDYNKRLEGDNVEAPFDRELLSEWGEFFDRSAMLINCSIGEPFMMKNFDELLDIFGDSGKFLEMTTNGQILTDRNIEKLLGRNIHLYISLDAGTADTYAKVRNDRFDKILDNLRRLIAAKGGPGGLPKVFLVFMPMKVNVHELEDFVRICADLEVDRMILRPLNWLPDADLNWERNGYSFVYNDELLPFEELVRVSARAELLCERYGVELSDQMDFGGSMEGSFPEIYAEERRAFASSGAAEPVVAEEPVVAVAPPGPEPAPVEVEEAPRPPLPSIGADNLPACWEPWKSLYILRRGVLPCCYGGKPIAEMHEYREAWNSELMQGIRSELAAGRFHSYCLESPACPIVRKAENAAHLTPEEGERIEAVRRWRRIARAVDRALGGVPKRIYRGLDGWLRLRRQRRRAAAGGAP